MFWGLLFLFLIENVIGDLLLINLILLKYIIILLVLFIGVLEIEREKVFMVGVGWFLILLFEFLYVLSVVSVVIINDVENECLMNLEYKEFELFFIFFIFNIYFFFFEY